MSQARIRAGSRAVVSISRTLNGCCGAVRTCRAERPGRLRSDGRPLRRPGPDPVWVGDTDEEAYLDALGGMDA
ncbi:hypothetical protein GCM10010377_22370 [Streptomyces viridiviolaceus]|nr:hypothetical protein GCM10010377_22370 [Streptomyces viridiviolaceus]